MQLHNLKRNKANKEKKLVGRGGTRGKTSGRGTKGQNARSGRKKRPEMRDIIKRIPKLRGRGKNSLRSRFEKPVILNLDLLDKHFKEGEIVSTVSLLEKGLINKTLNKLPRVKILAGGKMNKKLKFEGLELSKKLTKNNG